MPRTPSLATCRTYFSINAQPNFCRVRKGIATTCFFEESDEKPNDEHDCSERDDMAKTGKQIVHEYSHQLDEPCVMKVK